MDKVKSTSLIFILLVATIPVATASLLDEQYASPPIVLHNDASSNFTQAAIATDSYGNLHTVSVRDEMHLYYSLTSRSGEILIDMTQITNAGLHKIWHPDMVVDENDKIHIVWADKSGQHKIMYTVLNPWSASLNGSISDDGTLSAIDDYVVSSRAQNRDWPAIDIDSQGGVHIVWEDSYDPLDKYFSQPQIYYTMLSPNMSDGSIITNFDDTLLTPVIGHKGHPDVVVDSDDYVQITWDDTRGGKVELSFIVDTSGSMYSEWADICTVVYGGNFASGGYFEGIKPLLVNANISVYETIYGLLGVSLPDAANSGNCAGKNQNSGPRATPLGQTPGNDSGGIRELSSTVYNGNTYPGSSGEDWGPGTNWACLSWKDVNGSVPGNPPTQDDHRWNPNATKFVIPVSDEGPKDGDPSQQADDLTSIEEAHDNCINAGVIPVGLYGQGYGGAGNIQSHFMDLTQCPNNVVSTQTRNCPGNTLRSSDAGGQTYEFPSGGSGANAMALLVEAMVYITTNNSREIYMTVLDPYGKMNNDPTWTPGATGHSVVNGEYIEDTGAGADGHLVVVNDTRVTIDDAYSFHPSIGVDMQGDTHIAWMDGRDYGNEKGGNFEVYYSKLRLRDAGEWNGTDEGLPIDAIKKIQDTPISNVEGNSGLTANRPFGGNSVFPALFTDGQNNVHIAWVDSSNATADEEIIYTRLNSTDLTGPGLTALDPWENVPVTSWASNKLGPNSGSQPSIGMPPAFSNDLGSGAHIAWSDSYNCEDAIVSNHSSICYVRLVDRILNYTFNEDPPFSIPFQPGETKTTLLNLSTEDYTLEGFNQFTVSQSTINSTLLSCDSSWNVSFRLLNQSESLPSLTFGFQSSTVESVVVAVTAPGDDQYEEGQAVSLCFEVVQTIGSWTRSVADITVNVSLVIEHAWALEFPESPQFGFKGELYTLAGTITNLGTAQDQYQIVSSPTSNSSCGDCIVSTGSPFSLAPGESRQVYVQVNLSSYETVSPYLTVENLDTGESFCDVLTASIWCAVDIIPMPTGDFVSVNSSRNHHLIQHGTCLNTTIGVDLEEAGFATVLNISVHNPSSLAVFYSSNVDISLSDTSNEFSITWCSESNSPLGDTVNTTVHVSVSEFESYSSNLTLTFIPYSPARVVIESLEDPPPLAYDDTVCTITGYLDANQYSGNATLVVGFSSEIFNRTFDEITVISSLGQALILESGQRVNFDRILKFSDWFGDDLENITIYVQVCDFGGCTVEMYGLERIPDSDGDGVGDDEDMFPYDVEEWLDSDDDGVGDNADDFPFNASESKDSDGDGFGDNRDVFPKDGNEWFDSDGDGYGDNMDVFPFNSLEHSDLDNDGIGDVSDAFPLDASRWEKETIEDSSWTKILSGDFSGASDEPVVMTLGISAILLSLLTLLQTNLLAQFIPESLRLVGFARSRRRQSKADQVWSEQLRSICQLMQEDVSGLREWLADEMIAVKGEGIEKEVLPKSIEQRLAVLSLLSSLNDNELSDVWKNQRLFDDSKMSDTISDLLDEQLFMDESDITRSLMPPILETQEPLSATKYTDKIPIVDAHGYEWIQNDYGEYLYRKVGTNSEWTKNEG